MAKSVMAQASASAPVHEEPHLSDTLTDSPNGHISPDDTAPDETSTEYELVEGLNLNLRNPDEESTNETQQETALADVNTESGQLGTETLTELRSAPVLDALYGSYPELLEARDEYLTEVILGPDDRIRIRNTAVYPWRAICALRITAANGRRFIGTGFLVSARTVITAGHCLYLHNEGGWARSVEVIPGLNDAARPYGSATSSALRSVTGWTRSRKREQDYGAIILPANARPGDRTGTFGFAVRNDAFLRNAALNLSGYPGDKGGNQQWFMAQRPKSVASRVITYEIDTMGGQSGSPVWVLENGKRFAVGIHTNGSQSGNSATRIEANVFRNLQNWKNMGL